MVGEVMQIENTAFCMLPNPTVFHWDKSSFSLRRLLVRFRESLDKGQLDDSMLRSNTRIKAIQAAASTIESQYLGSSHTNNGAATAPPKKKPAGEKPDLPEIISALHKGIKECDDYLKHADRLPLVLHVVRVHVQEVLRLLNGNPADASDAKGDGHSKASTHEETPPTLEGLDAATSGARHRLFMDLYVSWVRARVIRVVDTELHAEQANTRRDTAIAATEDALPVSPVTNQPAGIHGHIDGDVPESQEQHINDIWCTLVFRMVCWLLLHDFHKKDIQISKSEVFGSRLPVYIM